MNAIKFDKRSPEAQARPLDPPAAQRLSEVGTPTLVVAGALDHADILESAGRLTAGIPGAQHRIMAGSAHLPSMEQPTEFNQAVQTFLDHLDHKG